ncbi:MAG: class IV adenylate cyclase [Blastocatellales bacterium]
MSAQISHEIEVKLRFDNVDALRAAGLILTLQIPRHFEDNWLLDTADSMLGGKPAILRIRQSGEKGWLTYKEKAAPDASATRFKKRLEIETALDNPTNAVVIFERLGFQTWFRYQKYRTIYRAELPGGSHLQVMFDETPIGNFIELEGEEEAIAEAVALIGVEPEDFILESYLALQAAHCQQQNKPFQDMIFDQTLTEAE